MFGLKGSLRRKYWLWLSALVFLHFFLQAFLGTMKGLHAIAEGRTTLLNEFHELLPMMVVDAVTVPLLMVAIWYVTKRLMQPLETVVVTAARISEGRLDERVAVPKSDDEVAVLATTLNSAFDRYREAVTRVRRFSSDASHQLRTPLAAIRNVGEVSLQKERSPEDYREAIGSMLEEVSRLSRIVEQLLMLSRLERPQIHEQFKSVALADVAHAAAAIYEAVYTDKQLSVVFDLEPGLAARGDAGLLEQVAISLLDNAIKFTPSGGTIRIATQSAEPGQVVLRVEDNGPGIPDDERTRIFERFVSILGADRHGTGLGLAIVHDIVKLHDGRIEALPNSPRGAVLQVTLPAWPS